MLEYQPIMARTEAGEQNTNSWAVNTALRTRAWLEGYIREPYPDEAQRAATRNKFLGAGAALAVVLFAAGVVAPEALPRASDYLRDNGMIASTTPIKRTSFTFPKTLPTEDTYAGMPGNSFVDLSGSNQVVDVGRAVVINTAPTSMDLTLRVNKFALRELATSTTLGTAIGEDRAAHIVLVPFSLQNPNKAAINEFMKAESDLIDESPELETMNRVSKYLYGETDSTIDNTKAKPMKSIMPISLVDTLYIQAARKMGFKHTSPTNLFVGVFAAGLLGGGGGSDQDALGYELSKKLTETIIIAGENTKLDPKNLPPAVTRFIENNPPISVTAFNKSKFDKEWLKSGAPFASKSTPPSSVDESYLIDPVDECSIGEITQSSNTAPAVINFAVGVAYKNPGPNKHITDQQYDYNGDGLWDTDFDNKNSGLQTFTADKPGTHFFAARVRFNKGLQTKPCYGSVDLK